MLAGLPGAFGINSPGPYDPEGAVPGWARGLGHTAPTYFCRFPGSALRRPVRLRTLPWPADGPVDGEGYSGRVKAELRQLSLPKRDAIPPDVRAAAAEAIAARAFPYQVKPGMVVSAYAPMQSELNPVPLMRKLADAGATLALPVVVGRGRPLIMREWAFGQPLATGVWGIREPMPGAPEALADILLVPLACSTARAIGSATAPATMISPSIACACSSPWLRSGLPITPSRWPWSPPHRATPGSTSC